MIQLYFLSILCNSFAGYILLTGIDNETNGSDTIGSMQKAHFSIKNPIVYLVSGILCIVTGVLKLLSPTMDGVLILGDLVPAAAGIIAGLMLIFGIYRQDSFSKSGELEKLSVNLLTFRKPIGIGLLIVSLVHFLFPQALFL